MLLSCWCYCQKQPLGVFCEKRRSWIFRGFHGGAPVLESLFNLVAGLITCGSPVWFAKFLWAPILKNICERMLLYCCGFVLLFFMLWYNVPLIFNHFVCYLSIPRDQLSSVFSWSLTYLARALVIFLLFLFSLRHSGHIIQNLTRSLYCLQRAQVMVASPNCPKILLLLSAAHAIIGGDQVITQVQVE